MSSASSIRIYEIARQLKVDSARIVEICKKLGFDVKSHSSAIDEGQKKRIISELKKLPVDAAKKPVSKVKKAVSS